MITCNIFKIRPKISDNNFWPFEYVDDVNDNGADDSGYTEDFFTQRAISFCKSTTVRETFGLTFKDVMGMDYGMLLYLEKIANKLDEVRIHKLDEMDNDIKNGENTHE